MFIITGKQNNEIFGICKELKYWDNGYPLNVDANTAYPIEIVNVYEVETVPEEVVEGKYCYTPERSFYENKDWKELYDANVKVKELEQQVTDLQMALCDVYEMLPTEEV